MSRRCFWEVGKHPVLSYRLPQCVLALWMFLVVAQLRLPTAASRQAI